MDGALKEIKALGYEGVEMPLKAALVEEDLKLKLEANGLTVGFTVFTDGPVACGDPGAFGPALAGFSPGAAPGERDKSKVVQQHLTAFKEQVEAAQQFGDSLAYLNSHSGRDFFTLAMGHDFFGAMLEWQQQNGFAVSHETHRARYLYSPWAARDFVPEHRSLRITADLSHWVNVAESSPSDLDLTQVVPTPDVSARGLAVLPPRVLRRPPPPP
jgi:sugar phosphate isomerase/epimerase